VDARSAERAAVFNAFGVVADGLLSVGLIVSGTALHYHY
jgi:hypothetical protein